MFGPLGVQELLLIFALILIVFGPRRIPEIGRTLGKALGEFRKATDDLKNTIEREVRIEELKKITPQIITPLESISRSEPTSRQGDESTSGTDEATSPPGAPLDASISTSESTSQQVDESTSGTDEATSLPEAPLLDDSSTRRLVD